MQEKAGKHVVGCQSIHPGPVGVPLQSATGVSSVEDTCFSVMAQEMYTQAVTHQAHERHRNPVEPEAPGRPAQTACTDTLGNPSFHRALGVGEDSRHTLMGISLYRPENLQP